MAKTALLNVRVFNGHELLPPSTVVIDGSQIASPTDTAGATELDAQGLTLLPGLIDAHVHLHGPENLAQFREAGVTTVMDMASFDMEVLAALRAQGSSTSGEAFPTVLSAGIPASSPGSRHSHIPGFPPAELLPGPEAAAAFVRRRVDAGSDYIKLIADVPGPSQETLDALVAAAKAHGKQSVAHAASLAPAQMALKAGVDMLTHVPLDRPLDEESVAAMVRQKTICIPTLTMMAGAARNRKLPPQCYEASRDSVRKMYEAGVPILLGTDANAAPGGPAMVEHGTSLHEELQLLVQAGVSTVDALRAATVLPARHFGLEDRGVVDEGKRADLVLIEGDPLADISVTKSIRRLWCGGIEYVPASKG